MISFSNMIDSFQPADGPPPQTLGAFMRWCLSGSWSALWFAAFFSAAAGAMEAGTALILGNVIDATVTLGPDGFFSVTNARTNRRCIGFFPYRATSTVRAVCCDQFDHRAAQCKSIGFVAIASLDLGSECQLFR